MDLGLGFRRGRPRWVLDRLAGDVSGTTLVLHIPNHEEDHHAEDESSTSDPAGRAD
jgi:hypothetical protein